MPRLVGDEGVVDTSSPDVPSSEVPEEEVEVTKLFDVLAESPKGIVARRRDALAIVIVVVFVCVWLVVRVGVLLWGWIG